MGSKGIGSGLAAALALILTACGGDDAAPPAAAPVVTTIGPAGGAVRSDGAEVIFPAKALTVEVTVRITKDSTGAPPLPPGVDAAGPVFTITPHTTNFRSHAEVVVPVERPANPRPGQLVLLTAQPGDTGWTVLSGASQFNGAMRARVMHFSYFRAVTLVDFAMPTLVTTISADGDWGSYSGTSNNVGGAGIGQISPDYEFNASSPLQQRRAFLKADLTWPQSRTTIGSLLNPVACRPVTYGHDGASWTLRRDGEAVPMDRVFHYPVRKELLPYEGVAGAASSPAYPSHETPGSYEPRLPEPIGPEDLSSVPGFGAVHFYGQASPRRGDFLPTGSNDVWASPPAGNDTSDDRLTWSGLLEFQASRHNGRVSIETSVQMDCNLKVSAVPLAFQVNLTDYQSSYFLKFSGLNARLPEVYVAPGETADVRFLVEKDSYSSVGWEYSRSATNWERLPLPDGSVTREVGDLILWGGTTVYREFQVVIPNVQAAHAGWYRANACSKPSTNVLASSYCLRGSASRLVVVTDPPVIIKHPVQQVVQVGETATFSSQAAAPSIPASVRWQRLAAVAYAFGSAAWVDVPDSQGSFYDSPPLTMDDSGMLYRAVWTNAQGSTASNPALLQVIEQVRPPLVTGQPVSQTALPGADVVFVATVSGTPPFGYQWRWNGANIPGANSLTLALNDVTAGNNGRYDVVVTNVAGTATSNAARLAVTDGALLVPPAIAASPASLIVEEGNAANFAVAVSGIGPYTYAWLKNGTEIPTGIGASFGIHRVSAADAGRYSVRVSNAYGSVESAAATLTVTTATQPPAVLPPTIVTQPISLAVSPGNGATFAVAVTGTGPFTYQWKRGGATLAGATGAVYHVAAVSALDAGTYSVEVRNSVGMAFSTEALLILVGAPVITAQPLPASVFEGGQATFNVSATGTGRQYQWMRNGVAIPGASAASYTTPALTLADSGLTFAVIVYNAAGLVISSPAVLTVTPNSTIAWGAPTTIAIGTFLYPAAALDDNGRGLAVWVDRSGRVLSSNGLVGDTWSTAAFIDAGIPGYRGGFSPHVAAAAGGAAVAAWGYESTTGWGVAAALGTTFGWTAPVSLSDFFSSNGPAVATIDDSGRAVVLWEVNGRVYARSSSAAGWTPQVDINGGAPAALPRVAVNGSGLGFILYSNSGGENVRSIDLATGAIGPVSRSFAGGNARLAVNESGGAAIVFYESLNNVWHVRASTYTPQGGWTEPVSIDVDVQIFFQDLAVAIGPTGNVIAAWAKQVQAVPGGPYLDTLYSNQYTPGVGWATAVNRANPLTDGVRGIQIAANRNGRFVLTWTEYEATIGYQQMWARVYDGGGWQAAAAIQSQARYADVGRPPLATRSLAMAPTQGYALQLWAEFDDATRLEPMVGAFLR